MRYPICMAREATVKCEACLREVCSNCKYKVDGITMCDTCLIKYYEKHGVPKENR